MIEMFNTLMWCIGCIWTIWFIAYVLWLFSDWIAELITTNPEPDEHSDVSNMKG